MLQIKVFVMYLFARGYCYCEFLFARFFTDIFSR
jgi:hypothetical protein